MKRSKNWVPIIGNYKKIVLSMNLCLILILGSSVSIMASEKEETKVNSPFVVVQQDEKTLTGTVKDPQGEPVPGAAIMVKGTTIGTITDFDGVFNLSVPGNANVILVSFIGYANQEITIGAQTNFNIVLKDDTEIIEEVMVVAYGAQKKESVVGAISQVKGEALTRSGQSTISNALSGQAPGVVTVQQSGMPGDTDAKIYVRGQSSFSGDNQPLILVDGVERSMSNIDPSEVQSISVLKDASATAVYGVKGANGVILVTTKRGQLGRMEISVNAEMTFTKPSFKREVENSYNTLVAINDVYRNKQEWGKVVSDEILEHYRIQDMPYIYPDSDPSDFMLKDWGKDHKVNVSARGGTKTLKYFVSLGAVHEGGLFNSDPQTQYDAGYSHDRYTFRMNFDFKLTESTTVKLSSGGNIGQTNTPGETYTYIPSFIMYNSPYDTPYIYPAEFVEQYPDEDWPYLGDRLAGSNIELGEKTPYILHNYSGSSRNTNHQIGTDFTLKQDLGFITKGLSASAMISYNSKAYYNAGKINYSADYYVFQYNGEDDYDWTRFIAKSEDNESIIRPAYYSAGRRNGNPVKDMVYQTRLDYRRNFGSHNVSGLALFKRREWQSGSAFQHYEEEWVGRATYDFKNKYMLELSVGISGSEQFAPNNRFGIFPAYAIGWNVAKEPFMADLLPAMNNFKIRYSYGETGSDATIAGFLYEEAYENSKGYNLGDISSSSEVKTIKEDKVANPYAQWEHSIKNNLGFEMGFQNNTYTFSVDLFNEKRDGILMERNSISSLFGQDMKAQNIGETKSHGYEIVAGLNKQVNKIRYWVNANFNFNENRIVKRDEPAGTPDYLKTEGMPIGQVRSSYNIGYYQNMDELLNYSVGMSTLDVVGRDMVLDFNGDGVINSNDVVPYGYANRPSYTFGLTAGLAVGNFDFNFLVQGATQVTRSALQPNPVNNYTKQGILIKGRTDVWTPDNRDAEYANWGVWSGAQKNRVHAKYARLKSVELGYNFKGNVIKKVGLSSARLYVQGTNLLTYAPEIKLGDPEAEPSATVNNNYPLPKRINLGVKVNF
ncbi:MULTISPECIES: SusC/RagA family TonB-linked outer membrane protein [unclassified Saccharicrinis]|uniref:SusC/RagA family TonB-linked outer membrane protein n=1 Tax=unclassified Saccharicrinis TaxID=2646859 RepID=UPI003D33E97E